MSTKFHSVENDAPIQCWGSIPEDVKSRSISFNHKRRLWNGIWDNLRGKREVPFGRKERIEREKNGDYQLSRTRGILIETTDN